jgi:hypothetical protein
MCKTVVKLLGSSGMSNVSIYSGSNGRMGVAKRDKNTLYG